jgi:hypothetical protein
LAIPVSQKSIDLIIYYEVGGRSYYDKKYTRPIVPAWQSTASGVTVEPTFTDMCTIKV